MTEDEKKQELLDTLRTMLDRMPQPRPVLPAFGLNSRGCGGFWSRMGASAQGDADVTSA